MFKKRIPTILGVTLLLLGLGAGLYLVGQATIIPRASAEETPKEIKITNLNENSFTVSWITEIAATGFVRYGTEANKLSQTVADDRDQLSGSVQGFVTHHVTVRNLKPATAYYFKLGSGTKKTLYDNSGQPYQITTPAVLGTPPPADTIYGTVVQTGGATAEGAIVYVSLPGASPLSALAKGTGNWAVSLSTARTSDLSAYVSYDRETTAIELFVQGGSGQTATAMTTTANDTPVPQITLGQTHDFRAQAGAEADDEGLPPGADLDADSLPEATAAAQPSASPVATGSGGFATGSLGGASKPQTSTFKLGILNPEAEGETVATVKPEIFGTSPKDVTLTIVVESPTTYTDTVAVGSDGLWEWTPPANLAPGEHTVTVSYTDSNGILQQIKRQFFVAAAAGGTPAFVATPSAAASPSATSSAAPRVSMPSTEGGVPTAGVLTPTLTLFILGAGLLSVGIFWQLWTIQRQRV